MPPKDPKAKPKKAKLIIIDGANLVEMKREQLENYAVAVNEEIKREKKEKQAYYLECDKIRTYWDITRTQLYQQQCVVRHKDRQVEVSAVENALEIAENRQMVKYLQHVRQEEITQRRVGAMLNAKQQLDDHTQQENLLLEDIKELTRHFREQDMMLNEELRAMKLHSCEQVYNACRDFETLATETERTHEEKTEKLRQEMKEIHTAEIKNTEKRKNTELKNLTEEHAQILHDVKSYYNEISINNLALITTLQEQLIEERSKKERLTKEHSNLIAEHKRLMTPLKMYQEKVNTLNFKLRNYENDMLKLMEAKTHYQKSMQNIGDLKFAYMALSNRAERLQAERDSLYQKYTQGILEVQQLTGTRNLLLQNQVRILTEQSELRDAILSELASIAKLDSTASNEKLQKLINDKNNIIKDYQYEMARIGKLHDDLLQTYEGKLAAYNIGKNELGHEIINVIHKHKSP